MNPSVVVSWLLFCGLLVPPCSAITNPTDVNALRALQAAWSPTLFSWTGDPCQNQWTGITCDDSDTNVIKLALPSMQIWGIIPGQIGNLTSLQVLDLSYNDKLTGTLPPELFLLLGLSQLLLQNCGLFGTISPALGNLKGLTYLALNHNFFTGPVPHTIGQLSELFWFDLSSNQLNGNLPKSIGNLTKTKHFHLQGNNFTGITDGAFNPEMAAIHILLNNNSFQGPVPSDLGALAHLDILRLDSNGFTIIPATLTELTTLTTMQLDHNNIRGNIPNLELLTNLQVLDLGHNPFTASSIPPWLSTFPNSTFPNLQYLGMEASNLEGEIPASLFSPLNLTSVFLGYNNLTGTLDLGRAGPILTDVDLEQNSITSLSKGSFSGTLNLQGNLICEDHGEEEAACNPAPPPPAANEPSCGCTGGMQANPATTAVGSCLCSLPVRGALIFIALKVSLDSRVIPTLQAGFMKNIPLLITSQNQVSITIISRLAANITIFPNDAEAWDVQEANVITALISSKAILFPTIGPYEYSPYGPYIPPGATGKKSKQSRGVKIGLGIGVTALAAFIVCICGYAFLQKRRADKAEEVSKPFASWGNRGLDINGAPRVKGARMFSLSEMKRATNNFSKVNEIGTGGYGKVYKGILPSGEKVAIKKAQASSQQGGGEFRNEIELLSRVHHRNLVGLVGFCFEQQMLVYEFMPNGTLRDSLSGRTKIKMDWYTRISVALGSARGIAYLHSEADPPIIHRDVKSSNILLDEKLIAKVADFGLSKLAPDYEGTGLGHVSTQVKGTLGYLDPEYYTSQRLTDKSDVYSFGIVLLELLTSRQPIENGKFIVREVRTVMQTGGLPELRRLLDAQLVDCPQEELKAFLDVALLCVEEVAAVRPTMKQVVKELEMMLAAIKPASPSPILPPRALAPPVLPHESQDLNDPVEMDSPFQYSGGFIVPVVIEPK